MQDSDYLTVRDIAEMLGIAPLTVRRRISAGKLPAVRFGRRVLIPRTGLDAALTPYGGTP